MLARLSYRNIDGYDGGCSPAQMPLLLDCQCHPSDKDFLFSNAETGPSSLSAAPPDLVTMPVSSWGLHALLMCR